MHNNGSSSQQYAAAAASIYGLPPPPSMFYSGGGAPSQAFNPFAFSATAAAVSGAPPFGGAQFPIASAPNPLQLFLHQNQQPNQHNFQLLPQHQFDPSFSSAAARKADLAVTANQYPQQMGLHPAASSQSHPCQVCGDKVLFSLLFYIL